MTSDSGDIQIPGYLSLDRILYINVWFYLMEIVSVENKADNKREKKEEIDKGKIQVENLNTTALVTRVSQRDCE